MIKCVAIDLDGTLFKDHGETVFDLSKESETALEYLKENNIKICIASGRSPEYIKKLFKKYDLGTTTFCSFNGAVIYDNDKQVVFNNLSKQDVLDIYNVIANCDVSYRASFMQTLKGNRVMEKPEGELYEFYRKNAEKEKLPIEIKDVPYYEYILNTEEKAAKLSVITYTNYDANEIYKKAKEKFNDRFSITTSTVVYVEFTNPKANKGSFIDYLMNAYGYKDDEIAVMGDSYNDYTMLKKVKYSYVMNHGEEALIKMSYAGVKDVFEAAKDIVKVNENE